MWKVIARDGDVRLVSGLVRNETGAENAETAALQADVDGTVVSLGDAVFTERHGLEAVVHVVAGHFLGLCIQAGEAILRRNPQVDAVHEETVDLVVRQPVGLRENRDGRLVRKAVLHLVEAAPVGAGPDDVPVGNERHTDREPFHAPGFQSPQVDDAHAFDRAHPQLVGYDAGTQAGGQFPGVFDEGGASQVIEKQPAASGQPDIVVDMVVHQSEDDIDTPGQLRLGALRNPDDIGGGLVHIVQVPVHGAEPDAALAVLAEGRD